MEETLKNLSHQDLVNFSQMFILLGLALLAYIVINRVKKFSDNRVKAKKSEQDKRTKINGVVQNLEDFVKADMPVYGTAIYRLSKDQAKIIINALKPK